MRPHLPLNALRAFEASARHLSFTLAANELSVTQAAVSQQVRMLEERLATRLFKRVPRGLALTDEGRALLPVLSDAFNRIEAVIKQFDGGRLREVLTVGVVGTFAVGWLLPRLKRFRDMHPFVELRLLTHNNLVDLAAEGLDFAVRFGAGGWPGTEGTLLLDAPLTVLCAPAVAQRLSTPGDLTRETLLRSYRADEWSLWFAAAGLEPWTLSGPVFDSSRLMVEAAVQGAGVALAPPCMFASELRRGTLVRPFQTEVSLGGYWLVWLRSRALTPGMRAFHEWALAEASGTVPAPLNER
ncbi:LysR family transcriptional regulator [Bordetella bronchialis]|uniref:LysR family transcriptional regulator n=1 Tax=Bordetella bronchialis TaxID=463025 RepID=A0A193FGI5_9BORD|nr:LysR family transcriptional regulator [Bordetella bronchialis]ANN66740.1 LysR family transcriptional regulator [Bordetella bronchialis]ANN71817.1 LysR family transcriptional regulator [Bordetella bronchialis]